MRGMLSVLVIRPANAFDLAVTLQGLVAGAVDGLVREVIVIDSADGEVLKVADHAGCRILAGGEVLDPRFHPKGDWLLMPVPGQRLPANWIEASARHMGQAGSSIAARFPSVEPMPFWQRLQPRGPSAWLVPADAALRRMRGTGRVEPSASGLRVVRLRAEPAS